MESSDFDAVYLEAIQASGNPTQMDRAELCVDILEDANAIPSSPNLWPISTFIRARLAANDIPLNWLLGSRDRHVYQPEAIKFRDSISQAEKLFIANHLRRSKDDLTPELEAETFSRALLLLEGRLGRFPTEKDLKRVDMTIRALGFQIVVDMTIIPFKGPPLRVRNTRPRPINFVVQPWAR